MDRSERTVFGGVSFGGLLLIAFVVLKLTNVISWPWIWVLAPFWVPLLLSILLYAIVFVYTFRRL